VRGTGLVESLEEQPHALLDLRVRIEHDAAMGVVDEADREPAPQLTATRLVDQPAA
jgi:hypothetical protein